MVSEWSSSADKVKNIPRDLQEGRDRGEGEGAEARDSSKEVDRGLTVEDAPEGAEAPGENNGSGDHGGML